MTNDLHAQYEPKAECIRIGPAGYRYLHDSVYIYNFAQARLILYEFNQAVDEMEKTIRERERAKRAQEKTGCYCCLSCMAPVAALSQSYCGQCGVSLEALKEKIHRDLMAK